MKASFLFFGVGVCSQEPPQPATKGQVQPGKLNAETSTNSNIKTKDNDNSTPKPVSPINKMDTHSSNAKTQNTYKENSGSQSGAMKDDPITTYTFWLMIFTGALVICNVGLWLYTMKAAQAAKITAETSRLRDRAYLYLSPSVLPYPPGNITHWGIGIVIENAGVMPAKKVKLKYAFADSKKIKWTQAEWTIPHSSLTIGPKRTLSIQGKDILIATINKIVEGKAEVFIMAEVIYVDEFSPGGYRATQMNARLNVDSAGGYSFGYTPEHNCTDDDCQN